MQDHDFGNPIYFDTETQPMLNDYQETAEAFVRRFQQIKTDEELNEDLLCELSDDDLAVLEHLLELANDGLKYRNAGPDGEDDPVDMSELQTNDLFVWNGKLYRVCKTNAVSVDSLPVHELGSISNGTVQLLGMPIASSFNGYQTVREVSLFVQGFTETPEVTSVPGILPMESAPKDGTYILLFGDSGYTSTNHRCEVCRYDAEYRPLAPWQTYSDDAFTDSGGEPVGWLPLPGHCTGTV